jgi:hypothetical protein
MVIISPKQLGCALNHELHDRITNLIVFVDCSQVAFASTFDTYNFDLATHTSALIPSSIYVSMPTAVTTPTTNVKTPLVTSVFNLKALPNDVLKCYQL